MPTRRPYDEHFSYVTVRMPIPLHDAIIDAARADSRSVSNWITVVLEKAVKEPTSC